ncbi:sensor histidine kinase [Aquabacterium sp.]|uniref:sensor histidine kinase n=1 Tax=Aquabacterium sp. TaxID=1872578 RepID=UPI002BCAAB4B|nr:sensor histidine kinase [Aquabacterium sp.]HSW05054.1 sensor histidine kinase [Aquabacterium sp.]
MAAATSGRRVLSLRRKLLLWLLLPQLIMWMAVATLAYRIALNYALKGIDQSLTQSVRSLARQVKPAGSGLYIDFPRAAQAIMEEDPGDPVSYMVSSPPGSFVLGNVGRDPLPAPPAAGIKGEPMLYDAPYGGKPFRHAALEVDYGDADAPQRMRVQVAKSLAVRERIARELIYDMLVPLVLLGAVLGFLVSAGVRRGLMPLQKLQSEVAEKSVETLHPIEMTQAPREVHALADAVNRLLAAVRRSMQQEKRFLNDAAHQLRTPLAGLKGQLELALAETDPDALKSRLVKVNAAVERSAHLVHQLLSLARSEGEMPVEELDVAQLARELAREWTPRMLAQDIDFGYEGADKLLLRGNALLIREALNNLIDNASRYAGRGATITLRARAEDALAVLEVEDDGPGISEAERLQVFQRFVRASDVPGGVGLGLAIVREIAQRHGGDAQIRRVEPHGLVARIELARG